MTKPMPVVLQLQADAINPSITVAATLRLAKVIATKLDQKEALQWIDRELKDYTGFPQRTCLHIAFKIDPAWPQLHSPQARLDRESVCAASLPNGGYINAACGHVHVKAAAASREGTIEASTTIIFDEKTLPAETAEAGIPG